MVPMLAIVFVLGLTLLAPLFDGEHCVASKQKLKQNDHATFPQLGDMFTHAVNLMIRLSFDTVCAGGFTSNNYLLQITSNIIILHPYGKCTIVVNPMAIYTN